MDAKAGKARNSPAKKQETRGNNSTKLTLLIRLSKKKSWKIADFGRQFSFKVTVGNK